MSNEKLDTGWSERGNDADVRGDHSEVNISIKCVLGEVQSEHGAGAYMYNQFKC